MLMNSIIYAIYCYLGIQIRYQLPCKPCYIHRYVYNILMDPDTTFGSKAFFLEVPRALFHILSWILLSPHRSQSWVWMLLAMSMFRGCKSRI